MPRYDAAQRKEILDAYQRGDKIEVISSRFGCSKTYPSQLIKRHGLRSRISKAPYDYDGTAGDSRQACKSLNKEHKLEQLVREGIPAVTYVPAAQIRELAQRGFNEQMIAARLRVPYREVFIALSRS